MKRLLRTRLIRFLAPHFANLTMFETIYPGQYNLHFCGSDGARPLTA
jgi:hypothetical protein